MNLAAPVKLATCLLSLGLGFLAATQVGMCQGRSPGRPVVPPNPMLEQPLELISGKVITGDGSPANERVAIESLCNGSKRREGYSDPHGNFQFQIGHDLGVLQDAN